MSLRGSFRVRILLAVLVAIVLFGAGMLWLPAAVRQLRSSMTREPAAFTELYFTDPSTLPKHLVAGSPASFGFTIRSDERSAVTYSYVVTATGSGPTATVTQGKASVRPGEAVDLSATFVPRQPATTYLFVVRLLGRLETIHFTGTT
ncbi:MAG TPA: hypothetical protein VG779_08550 [Actinomycetota bacterium]|jgi:hypothetical protein|nr:hypothetical protein [Actinomycetota bacterium]